MTQQPKYTVLQMTRALREMRNEERGRVVNLLTQKLVDVAAVSHPDLIRQIITINFDTFHPDHGIDKMVEAIVPLLAVSVLSEVIEDIKAGESDNPRYKV